MVAPEIVLQATQVTRLIRAQLVKIAVVGNTELLDFPLLGLVGSRSCPGGALIDAVERVAGWVRAGRVVISGFHSPLEQQVLKSLLRRNGRAVKVLARGMSSYRPHEATHEVEWDALSTGRLSVISCFPLSVSRVTRNTALNRNRLVLDMASDIVAPHVENESPLEAMLHRSRAQ